MFCIKNKDFVELYYDLKKIMYQKSINVWRQIKFAQFLHNKIGIIIFQAVKYAESL